MEASEERGRKVRRAAARLELDRRRCANSPAKLCQLILRDDHGLKLLMEEVQMAWFRHIAWCWQRDLFAVIQAPFGHGKSTGLVVGVALWVLGNDPHNPRIKIVSNADDTATQRVMGIRRVIETGKRYRLMYPHVRPDPDLKWTHHELYMLRQGGSTVLDPTVQAKGVFSTGIAGRASHILFDDPCDLKNTIQEPGLKPKVKEEVDGTWLSRLEPDGKGLWVATAWATDDATAHMMAKPNSCTLVQRVREDMKAIECEVYGADESYPLPKAA
jgi:hypothetical protein